MSTRSLIGIVEDGKVNAIFCHWDGYISHTGTMLTKFYNDLSSAKSLVQLGDIQSVKSTIGDIECIEGNRYAPTPLDIQSYLSITEFGYLYIFRHDHWEVQVFGKMEEII